MSLRLRSTLFTRLGLVFVFLFAGGVSAILKEQVGSSVAFQQPVEARFKNIYELLQKGPIAHRILQKVATLWGLKHPSLIVQNLKWGESSRTDTVLTRRFNPQTGVEERERQTTIFLRRDQSDGEIALDLIHELVHAGARPTFDPYDPELTVGKYIWNAIEGEGGEVDAVLAECQVAFELSLKAEASISRCQNYIEKSGLSHSTHLSRELVRKDFYRTGKWYSELKENLDSELSLFPLLSQESPQLYSSTGHAPYPAALMEEFHEITEVACVNSRSRLNSSQVDQQGIVRRFVQSRCKS